MLALHDQHKGRPILRALGGGSEFEISSALSALDFLWSAAGMVPQRLNPDLLLGFVARLKPCPSWVRVVVESSGLGTGEQIPHCVSE